MTGGTIIIDDGCNIITPGLCPQGITQKNNRNKKDV
jgi:hypothetical protein